VNDKHIREHPSAEVVQALLEGELSASERAPVEEHLAACARCAAEVDGWRVLFEGLRDLPTLAPGEGFTERVLAGIEVAAPLPLAARVRTRLVALVSRRDGHPEDGRLQDLTEGLLPARQAARIRSHLDACPACASRAEAWRAVMDRLGGLERLEPSEGFAARVMARVRVPTPAPAVQRVPEWRRALAWAGKLVPQSRKAWAALSGVAVTPAATLGLLLWTVFTHPALTPGALVSFAWWKASDLASLAWGAIASRAMESAQVFGVFSFFQSLALSPTSLVAAFVAFSAGTLLAVWVLYRNLVNALPADARHAHASHP
jgi:anti-sigma factor RsiW